MILFPSFDEVLAAEHQRYGSLVRSIRFVITQSVLAVVTIAMGIVLLVVSLDSWYRGLATLAAATGGLSIIPTLFLASRIRAFNREARDE